MNDDLISRRAAIEAVDSETVSTNPEHFKSSEKFIKFMDDADIASFGKWQWANGFNTALTVVGIDLKKLPSAQPEIIHCRECKYAHLTYGGDCKYCDKWLDDDGFNLTLYLDGNFHCGYAER